MSIAQDIRKEANSVKYFVDDLNGFHIHKRLNELADKVEKLEKRDRLADELKDK